MNQPLRSSRRAVVALRAFAVCGLLLAGGLALTSCSKPEAESADATSAVPPGEPGSAAAAGPNARMADKAMVGGGGAPASQTAAPRMRERPTR
jgi:hypothetical protein